MELIRADTLGRYTSASRRPDRPISSVVLSVNVTGCRRDALDLAAFASVKSGDDWSPWFCMLRRGQPAFDEGVLNDPMGLVDVDELRLSEPATEIRCRINWQSADLSCQIRRVTLCVADNAEWSPSAAVHRPVRLEVPFLSQWDAKRHHGRRVCSPTCLAMVAQFHGQQVSIDEMASLAFDPAFDVYGNWSASMLAMSILGFRATVERARTLESLDAALDSGEPVVTSFAFGKGELSGSPIESTKGHLVVVCGRSESGDFLVRDPAASGTDDWREYSRAQFERAWLGHGGIHYRIRKDAPA